MNARSFLFLNGPSGFPDSMVMAQMNDDYKPGKPEAFRKEGGQAA